MRLLPVVLLSGSILLSGCHSKYIQATLTNRSGAVLHQVQVDYPSASFGTEDLQPGAVFHYRFKLLGNGPVKVSFTDARMQDHQQTGPVLQEGEEGVLQIEFPTQSKADFQVSVHP